MKHLNMKTSAKKSNGRKTVPNPVEPTMQAIVLRRFGGPEVLSVETVSRPVPGPGQFLIKIKAASVNPVDHKIRTGKYKMFRPQLPAIIGRDIAGTVCAKGPGAGGALQIGDEVFGMLDYVRGAYSQYTIGTVRELARRPQEVRVEDAGALGVAALTAWQGLFDHGHLKRGERVLIHGAAGGVGHLAVQFAKHCGAYVVATAGTADLKWVKKLGADCVIDYQKQLFENDTGNIDLVYDLIAGNTLDRSWQVLKERDGRIVSTLDHPPAPQAARRHQAHWTHMVVSVKRDQLAAIARLLESGEVRVHIGKTFPLAKAAMAHKLVESGHVQGKVLLTI
jgi:NADPH:quinone reductase-like Zn-dependent oxidoreductase